MAYRRRQGVARASTFKEEIYYPPDQSSAKNPSNSTFTSSFSFSPSVSTSDSLAAQAIRASAARRESYVYGGERERDRDYIGPRSKGFNAYEQSGGSDGKGFWGVLARKAKAILDDDNSEHSEATPARGRSQMLDGSYGSQYQQPHQSNETFRMDNPMIRRSLDKLTSSLNQIGDTFEKAFEEGRTIVENKTADIIQETRKLQIRRKGESPQAQEQGSGGNGPWQPLVPPAKQQNHETQLKASRDVAMATAAKAKLLLRELKTVKADLAFAKARCSQLEEENKMLRESREKGGTAADDDLIRLQLETLLAEKARLAHENEVYARENRFLREIVEYHQLTMQDVVYLDEGAEEVTEVYPFNFPEVVRMLSASPTSPKSPSSPSEVPPPDSPAATRETFSDRDPSQEAEDASKNDTTNLSDDAATEKKEAKRPAESSA